MHNNRNSGWRGLLRRSIPGLLLLAVGIAFLLYGIHRQEHQVVAAKSNIVCLECIGIG